MDPPSTGLLGSKEGGKDLKRLSSILCPHPRDIAWSSLACNKENTKQRKSARRTGIIILSIVTIVYSLFMCATTNRAFDLVDSLI